MSDPLTQTVGLLRPSMPFAKLVVATGRWAVCRTDHTLPFYCAVLEGACRLSSASQDAVTVEAGDFVLVPAVQAFLATSLDAPPPGVMSDGVETSPGVVRLGDPGEAFGTRMLVGHCAFGSHHADLLVSLLPRLVHVRGVSRLTTLVQLLDEEARGRQPGREAVLARLLEVLLIEALRAAAAVSPAPGLLRGLADERLAAALRLMHDDPTRAWTVAQLASAAGLSRSIFFERFRREVGATPMDYLLGWRMALAKDLLHRAHAGVGEVAERVGYGSASTFSTAFARHVGMPPAAFARAGRAA